MGVRSTIGREMQAEIISCSFDQFQKHYLPFIPARSVVQRVWSKLTSELKAPAILEFDNPSTSFATTQEEICKNLQDLAITKEWDGNELTRSRSRNDLFYHAVQDITPSGVHQLEIDACLTPSEKKHELRLEKIAVPFKFNPRRTAKDLHENQLQIIATSVHIMNEDPCRQFILAITVEANLMTVWYFSHSHSAKSQSVDIKEKPDVFVSVMISLLYATHEELGFDPNVFWIPKADVFVYKLNNRFYKTMASIAKHQRDHLTGRSKHIYTIKEVKSLDDPTPVDDKEKVLKDVWLDTDARSEGQIQVALFNDMKKFAANPNWRQDARLVDLAKKPESIEELDYLFQEKHYENLFLLIADEFAGVISKPIPEQSYHPLNLLPNSNSTPNEYIGPDAQHLTSVPPTRDSSQLKSITKEERTKRSYAPKRRFFIIFDDVCKTVDALPTVGDAFQVLAGCATALRLMYCAGWVHRDISTGNIMAVRGDGDKWNVKLADLEFAKTFPDDNTGGSHDPKTGTPFFMPYEILLGKYYTPDGSYNPSNNRLQSIFASQPKLNPVALLHNHQHDLESLFWVLLWLITSRVNHDDSANWAAPTFQEITVLHIDRGETFRTTIEQELSQNLRPELKDRLPTIVDFIRYHLMGCMITHSKEGDWKDPKSYSLIHAMFFLAFRDLNNPSQRWATVTLQKRSFTAVHFPRPQFKSMARHMKCKVTDDGDYKLDPGEDEEDEPVSPTNAPVQGKVS